MTRIGKIRPLSEIMQTKSHAYVHEGEISCGEKSSSSINLGQPLRNLFGKKAPLKKRLKTSTEQEHMDMLSTENTQQKGLGDVACFEDFIPDPLEEYNRSITETVQQHETSNICSKTIPSNRQNLGNELHQSSQGDIFQQFLEHLQVSQVQDRCVLGNEVSNPKKSYTSLEEQNANKVKLPCVTPRLEKDCRTAGKDTSVGRSRQLHASKAIGSRTENGEGLNQRATPHASRGHLHQKEHNTEPTGNPVCSPKRMCRILEELNDNRINVGNKEINHPLCTNRVQKENINDLNRGAIGNNISNPKKSYRALEEHNANRVNKPCVTSRLEKDCRTVGKDTSVGRSRQLLAFKAIGCHIENGEGLSQRETPHSFGGHLHQKDQNRCAIGNNVSNPRKSYGALEEQNANRVSLPCVTPTLEKDHITAGEDSSDGRSRQLHAFKTIGLNQRATPHSFRENLCQKDHNINDIGSVGRLRPLHDAKAIGYQIQSGEELNQRATTHSLEGRLQHRTSSIALEEPNDSRFNLPFGAPRLERACRSAGTLAQGIDMAAGGLGQLYELNVVGSYIENDGANQRETTQTFRGSLCHPTQVLEECLGQGRETSPNRIVQSHDAQSARSHFGGTESPLERMRTRSRARTESSVPTRRCRGSTKLKSCRPEKGKVHKCFFYRGAPVGDEAKKLTNYLGIHAKNGLRFPLHKEWDEEHTLGFHKVMDAVMDDFDFYMLDGELVSEEEGVKYTIANMEEVVHWCYTNMQKKVRSWRNTLKGKRLNPEHSDQELQISPDPRVSNDEWNKLLQYWNSPTKAVECARNKVARQGPRPTHTTGAKSYSRYYSEMIEKGTISSELDAYLLYHQDKKGSYPNDYTKKKCEEIANTCRQRKLLNSTNHEMFIRVLDDVYGKHVGGYERGYGVGASRQKWKAAHLQHVKMQPYIKQQSRIQQLEAENALLRERLRHENTARVIDSPNQPGTSSSHNREQEHCVSPISLEYGN